MSIASMRARRITLAVIAIASIFFWANAATAETSENPTSEESEPGLGEYGRSGSIEPDEVPGVVSTEVLDLVNNSEELSQTRSEWNHDFDFVMHVSAEMSFRGQLDFLSDDPDLIAQLMRGEHSSIFVEQLQLYLSPDEAVEWERRLEVGVGLDRIQDELFGDALTANEGEVFHYGPDFAGIWQDQADSGRVKLHLVEGSSIDVASLAELVPTAEDLVVVLPGVQP